MPGLPTDHAKPGRPPAPRLTPDPRRTRRCAIVAFAAIALTGVANPHTPEQPRGPADRGPAHIDGVARSQTARGSVGGEPDKP